MSQAFRVSVVGPSRVGKTTLLTAILSETERMLAGLPVTVTMDPDTESRVRQQRRDLLRATQVGEFDAAALAGTQSETWYQVSLSAGGEAGVSIPFSILDYPGGWLDPDHRARNARAKAAWPECIGHITASIMLVVPIDAAVLMEADKPRQRAAVDDLLGIIDVQDMAREWAKARNQPDHRDEPAVVVLAPIKCEKYFNDNGGRGHEAGRLREQVRARYGSVLDVLARETPHRLNPVRIVYAPIDTYGCVELIESSWLDMGGGAFDFTAHYRFRGEPGTVPKISVKAAGTVMQELCRCVVTGQERSEAAEQERQRRVLDTYLARKVEDKGFWGTLDYYLSGEALDNRQVRQHSAEEIETIRRRRGYLDSAMKQLAAASDDPRVEAWRLGEVS